MNIHHHPWDTMFQPSLSLPQYLLSQRIQSHDNACGSDVVDCLFRGCISNHSPSWRLSLNITNIGMRRVRINIKLEQKAVKTWPSCCWLCAVIFFLPRGCSNDFIVIRQKLSNTGVVDKELKNHAFEDKREPNTLFSCPFQLAKDPPCSQ